MNTIIPFFPNPFNKNDIDYILNSKNNIDISKLGFNQSLYQFVDSGRSGIRLLLRSFGLSKKSRIGIPIMLCDTVRTAIIQEGFKPYYFNVDRNLQLIFNKTKFEESKISALILPHLYGVIHPDTEKIMDWCKLNNVYLIQDTAQSYGLVFNNKPLIELGDGGIYSFGPGKASTAAGGAIVFGLKPRIKYDLLPIVVRILINNKIKRLLLSRTIECKIDEVSIFRRIIDHILKHLTKKYIYSVNQIQFNAIKLIIENMDKIQKRREENWGIMHNILQSTNELIYIPEIMNNSLKFKYLIRVNSTIHECDEFEKKIIKHGILVNRVKRKDCINNGDDTPNMRYFEISTESSIPAKNIKLSADLINNIITTLGDA